MSKFTLYRVDVDSPRLARALGTVPGVAVGKEQAADEVPDEDMATPEAADEREAGGGLRETVPVPDTDVDATSAVKTYGLLGLGVSMVVLGVATVGIWVYRRRAGGDETSETPPPSTELDASETAGSAATPSPSTDDTATDPVSIVASADEETDPEPHGRTEGDRSDVEWTTRETTPAADEPDDQPAEAVASDEDEDEPQPTESVDAAPLLGVAFLAVSGAVVKWLQSGGDEA